MADVCGWFESFVNSEEYQTLFNVWLPSSLFESFVNSEEYQTIFSNIKILPMFESFVNSEEYQTYNRVTTIYM